MYVCLCRGVSDRVIRRCVSEGARTVAQVGRACGAGTVCGMCRPDIAVLVDDTLAAEATARSERGGEDALAAK